MTKGHTSVLGALVTSHEHGSTTTSSSTEVAAEPRMAGWGAWTPCTDSGGPATYRPGNG